jgi:hypothetical protein
MRFAQSMPEGTFGHAYGAFMQQGSFRADDRPPVRFVDDEELAYVAQRAREVHDLWHVLFNCRTTVLGELALKAVEFVQVCLCTLPSSESGWCWGNSLPSMRQSLWRCMCDTAFLREHLCSARVRMLGICLPSQPEYLCMRVCALRIRPSAYTVRENPGCTSLERGTE